MYLNVLSLAEPEGPVRRLIFDRRIPPAIEVKYMVGARQIQSCSAGLQRQNEQRRSIFLLLKTFYDLVALLLRNTPVQEERLAPERFLQMPLQHEAHFGKLRENQDAVSDRHRLFDHLREPGEFARTRFERRIVAQ